jgi:hypothetical protein
VGSADIQWAGETDRRRADQAERNLHPKQIENAATLTSSVHGISSAFQCEMNR